MAPTTRSTARSSEDSYSVVMAMFRGDDFPHEPPVVRILPLATSSDSMMTTNNNDNANDTVPVLVVADETNSGMAHLLGSAAATIAASAEMLRTNTDSTAAKIRGYISCPSNAGSAQPLLFLTSLDLIPLDPKLQLLIASQPQISLDEHRQKAKAFQVPPLMEGQRIAGGTAFEFVRDMVPLLSCQDLCGKTSLVLYNNSNSNSSNNNTSINVDEWKKKEDLLSHFLEHDRAVKTLHRTSTAAAAAALASAGNTDTSTTTTDANTAAVSSNSSSIQNYVTALAEFGASQMERQTASLTSNTGRQTASGAAKVAAQYKSALLLALQHASTHSHFSNTNTTTTTSTASSFLSPALLCAWHGVLCQDLVASAGSVRPANVAVRVGPTTFRPAAVVAQDLEALCTALRALETRLLNGSNNNNDHGDSLSVPMQAILFASAVFFGICDTHPFADGNGRVARIAANWVLRKWGLADFVVNFFATPAQRHEYTTATTETRRNISLVLQSETNNNIPQQQQQQQDTVLLLQAFRHAGCFRPLVLLFLDRLSKSVLEFQKLVQEKSAAAKEQRESRAARMFRERAAAGTCLICFEDNPNIATLCCGKACHLNCMAEWLSARNSCPQCRADLPSLPSRMRAAQNPQLGAAPVHDDTTMEEDDEDETAYDDDTTTDYTETVVQANEFGVITIGGRRVNYQDTTTDDETTSIVVPQQQQPPPPPPPPAPAMDQNMNADDTTTTSSEDETTHMTTASVDNTDTTTEDDTDTVQASNTGNGGGGNLPPPVYCGYGPCHNRSALDCSNSYCGRCCVLHGFYTCERHRSNTDNRPWSFAHH